MRCQGVCSSWKAWLHPRSLPLHQLSLEAGSEGPPEDGWGGSGAPTEWVLRMRPEVHRASVTVSGQGVRFDNPSVQSVYKALLAVRPREVSSHQSHQ